MTLWKKVGGNREGKGSKLRGDIKILIIKEGGGGSLPRESLGYVAELPLRGKRGKHLSSYPFALATTAVARFSRPEGGGGGTSAGED